MNLIMMNAVIMAVSFLAGGLSLFIYQYISNYMLVSRMIKREETAKSSYDTIAKKRRAEIKIRCLECKWAMVPCGSEGTIYSLVAKCDECCKKEGEF